ncbi:TrmH family RNA methyltransferase [Salinimicrobium flavum]|uniref:TrmH family RNA methyltransferase n=1 Tax=Salinimicrobium flavum TaxID=1737065 RepID=A0ABW5IVA7_9FLAO
MHKQITSLQNAAVKRLLQLQEKSRSRKKEGVFVIEGQREIGLAVKGGFRIRELYFCPALFSSEELQSLKGRIPSAVDITEMTGDVYEKVAYRGSTEGVMAVAAAKDLSLENILNLGPNPLILVAEAPEKPGNIGALLRTADAARVDAILIANPRTDMFNPNIIRSSVGCVFTTPVATGTTSEIIRFLKDRKIAIYGAALQASVPYDSIDYEPASAIVVGTEATGLSEEWLENTTQNIVIPMQGEIDSMNVSVAAGILIFEAKRQRGFK